MKTVLATSFFTHIERHDAHHIMKRLILGVFCALSYFAAKGSPATYTFTATGTGHLGDASFSDALLVFSAVADTTNITETLTPYGPTPIFLVPDATATVSVDGVGSATFTSPTYNIVNPQVQASGISWSNLLDILYVTSPALASYDLSSSFGPITGTPGINPYAYFDTTAGIFNLSSVSSVTFQADVVPEPSTFTLLSAALVGTAIFRWRRWPIYHPPHGFQMRALD